MNQRIENLRHVLQETILEYNDRVQLYNQVNAEVRELNERKQALTAELSKINTQIDSTNQSIQVERMAKNQLVDSIENNSGYPSGVRAIVNASASIAGYQGVLGELIEVKDDYDTAIQTALGQASNFIVMKDEQTSRQAINYLKNNKAGRATFLPMTSMKAREVKEDTLTVVSSMDGYLGVAMEFVSYQAKYKEVIASQLGNVLVAKDLKSANQLSHYSYAKYKVVTLEGDVVNVGGSMTGGQYRQTQHQSLSSKKKELERVQVRLSNLEKTHIQLKQRQSGLDNDLMELNNALMQKQISRGQLEEFVRTKRAKVDATKGELESLTNEKVEIQNLKSNTTENSLIVELNAARALQDKLTESIQAKRQLRMQYVDENEGYEAELREMRASLNVISRQLSEHQIHSTRLEGQMSSSLNRLNEEYQMTFEAALEIAKSDLDFSEAREEVLALRANIQALGHVNVDAIEEYESVSSRYEELEKQRLDLLAAQDMILKAISEMDQVMTEQFDSTFKKINEEFNMVFRRLFGGGSASVRYVDPEHVLESGIDIEVQPPGKKVQNISLFSGGEKALIALSCLFAILRVRPVPMCLLDEVEAALDQANVERFAKFLKDFSGKTQFIVVTHRPGTMEECDALYGATMQESGVTRLVSVQLQDAVELAE
jgi:chromosome segregation protein